MTYSDNITGGKIYIEQNFNSTTDLLTCVNSDGITGSYNFSTGIMTLSGTATAAAYQNFIRNVKFSTSSASGTRTIIISLTTSAGSVLYYSGTGHYYEYVSFPGITWGDAKSAAEAKSYNGNAGYLATITSAGENAFVAAKCAGNGWLGGSDDGHNKIWKWKTGPEAEQTFCHQNNSSTGIGVGVESTEIYQNFQTGEPNDWSSSGNGNPNGENYLHMYASNGTWNDFAGNNTGISGYIVEYGTTVLGATGSTASITVTIGAQTSSITYNLNGGTNNPANTNTYVEGVGLTFSDPTKTGYTFAGWYSDAGFTTSVTGFSTTDTGAKELFAKWTVNSYAITYNLNGGTNSEGNSATYTYEIGLTLQAPTRPGYTFGGWYSDS